MKKKMVIWLGLLSTLLLLITACSGTSPTPQTEEPKPTEIVVTEESKSTGPRTGDVAPDFILHDGDGNMVHLADELKDNRTVVLVFYYAYTFSFNQLVGLAEDHTKFEEKGAQIIALAVQSQDEAALSVAITQAQFPILADDEHTVADEYGVYNLWGSSEAAPSVFIISKDGRIIWDSIARGLTDRVPNETILENMPGAERSSWRI
jgi:peroxiredoxin Q/BCP